MVAKNIQELRDKYVGKIAKIIYMDGEPQYTNKMGVVTSVDSMGQLHGTWGGLAVNLDTDIITIFDDLE